MNKRILFVSALLSLAVCSCVEESRQPEASKEMKVSVSLADVQTRTCLGDIYNDGGSRKVCWSAGDAVSLNGYVSRALTEDQEGESSAEFKFYGGSIPYSVIYPASICGEFVGGEVTVNVPATQEYSPTSFGKGAAILYGYSEIEGAPVVLNNLCGAVKVTLSSQAGTTIKRAWLISNARTAPIAGEFVIDTKTGEYTVSEGIRTVTLDVQEVDIAPDGEQSFYFTIPHGDYPEGFTLKFYDKDDPCPMECLWLRDKAVARTEGGSESAGVVIQAGKLYEFKPVEFRVKKAILSGEEWRQFAQMVNDTGNETWKDTYLNAGTNTVNLGADIEIPEGTPQISSFPYVLEGNDFCITNDNATAALIGTLPAGGVIRNLTMKGKMKTPDSDEDVVELAAFVHTMSGGKIEDCTNEMAFDVQSKRVKFGTFAVMAKAGELWGCVNNADVTIKMDIKSFKSGNVPAYGAGLIAACEDPEDIINITGCTNNGDVVITLDNNKSGISKAGFAGIIGFVSGAVTDKYPKLVDCTNNGHVSLSFVTPYTGIAKAQYSVGGIVGFSASLEESATDNSGKAIPVGYSWISDNDADHSYICLENCMNTGNIRNNTTSAGSSEEYQVKVYTGGIAGTLIGLKGKHAEVRNCRNTGSVVPHTVEDGGIRYGRSTICGVCGGLLGLGGYVDITGGEVNASVGTVGNYSFAVAGVMGVAISKFLIDGLDVNTSIQKATSYYSPSEHALAFTNMTAKINTDLGGSVISNCRFAGSLTISTNNSVKTAEYPKTIEAPAAAEKVNYITTANYSANLYPETYTKGGVTCNGNSYWSNPSQQ